MNNNRRLEITQKINLSKIRSTDEINKPDSILSVGEVEVMTVGNITTLSGKRGAGKSQVILSVVRAFVDGSFLNFKGNIKDKKICWIDTEQSSYDVLEKVRNATSASSSHPEFLDVITTTAFTKKERIDSLEILSESGEYGIFIIDGIRQFVTSVNDDKEAESIIELMKKIVFETGAHILCVMHENKGDKNTRGHLGAELENVSERVINVSHDIDSHVFEVSCSKSRKTWFKPFSFVVDEKTGIPTLTESVNNSEKVSKKGNSIFSNYSEKQHIKNCSIVLSVKYKTSEEFKKSLADVYSTSYNKVRSKDGLLDELISNGYLIKSNLTNSYIRGSKMPTEIPFN